MKKSNLVLFTGVGVGILCWVISYLMFKGILMGSFIICGSGCEMWPGIRKPFGGCLHMCVVDRNGYYPLFFLIGLGCILLSGGILATRILLVNEKQKIEKKKLVPPAGVEPATSR